MYTTVGFTGADHPIRIAVSPPRSGRESALLHVNVEGDDFALLLDEVTARNLRDALNAVLPADGGIDDRGWPAAGRPAAGPER